MYYKLLRGVLTILMLALMVFLIDLYRTRNMPKIPAMPNVVSTIDGLPINIASLSQDKPLLIYFWATWCGPCKVTSPTIAWLNEHYSVITIALDSGNDAELMEFMQSKEYGFNVVNDAHYHLTDVFDVSVTPTIVILKDGKVSSSTVGISTPLGLWLRLLFA